MYLKMSKKVRNAILFVSFLFMMSICIPSAKSFDKSELNFLKSLPKDSIERYCYMKSLETGEDFESILEKEKNQTLSLDEYVDYRTKTATCGTISDGSNHSFTTEISTDMKVLKSRETNRVVQVMDFGNPYCSVRESDSEWSGGGFNINRINETSARISTTGQFLIKSPDLTVGGDIISVTFNLGGKTRVMTLVCKMGY